MCEIKILNQNLKSKLEIKILTSYHASLKLSRLVGNANSNENLVVWLDLGFVNNLVVHVCNVNLLGPKMEN